MRSSRFAAAKPCAGASPIDPSRSAHRRIQRKSCFFALKSYGGRVKSLAISAAYKANSLLNGSMEDQLNFFADQRIKALYQLNNN
jgi:hypothetical protein